MHSTCQQFKPCRTHGNSWPNKMYHAKTSSVPEPRRHVHSINRLPHQTSFSIFHFSTDTHLLEHRPLPSVHLTLYGTIPIRRISACIKQWIQGLYYLTSKFSVRHRVAQLVRHCATSRKFAGSIPDGVIGIFHWHNSSDRTMALGLIQPLTEMSIRNISWGVKAADA